MPIITMTTDYGTRDYYVAALKGVIRGIAPKAEIIDVTHEIPPFDVLHGAFLLWQIWSSFPVGTVHLAVVDPRVGSSRRLIAGQFDGRFLVAPDNGLSTLIHREYRAEALHVIENRRYARAEISATFHGRDILAPAAAHLANGVKLRDLGRATDRLTTLSVAHRAEGAGQALVGSVLYVDRFGTLITNVRAEQLTAPRIQQREWTVWVNDRDIGPIRSGFYEVAIGSPVALIGSSGLLEIALNQGRAIDHFAPIANIVIRVE